MDMLFLLRASSDNQFEHLKTFVRTFIKSTNIGAALRLAVQTAVSSTSGGRMGVPKAVVVVETDSNTCLLYTGVPVFPIGLGNQVDQTELSMLAGRHTQDNIIWLSRIEYLLAVAALDQSFTDKLCRCETV
ncbi:hypothetical protein cypCar_00007975 [Cyprinus carpio]|nr:hypothetical protein cypCar_00007975 [Cyprinus carpio]